MWFKVYSILAKYLVKYVGWVDGEFVRTGTLPKYYKLSHYVWIPHGNSYEHRIAFYPVGIHFLMRLLFLKITGDLHETISTRTKDS